LWTSSIVLSDDLDYITVSGQPQAWQLCRGIGRDGELLMQRENEVQLVDLSGAQEPFIWVCGKSIGDQEIVIQRIHLIDLSVERIPWSGSRVGALACAPDGTRAATIELPAEGDLQPRLWLWNGEAWSAIPSERTPDISSKLAWLDDTQLAFESAERRLAILNLRTSHVEVGPPGCCPAAASDIREWYAIANGCAIGFSGERPFGRTTNIGKHFNFGHVTTLRVTRDGKVFSWTEPHSLYRQRGYIQKRGEQRRDFPQLENGVGAVLGPYPST
jgi:hypothetical protein